MHVTLVRHRSFGSHSHTLFHLQLSTFKLEDEHKGTISQKLEEAQEVKFTLGRPKAALQRVQRNQVEERPAAEAAEEQVFHDLATRKTTTATSISTSDSESSGKVRAGLLTKPTAAAAATVAVAALGREVACDSPTPPRARPPSRSRGEFREYGPGEYNAMITRRARSFEREAGAGHRGGSSGLLRKRDASWDRKWRDEQDRNR